MTTNIMFPNKNSADIEMRHEKLLVVVKNEKWLILSFRFVFELICTFVFLFK